jgi:hypothetical protein
MVSISGKPDLSADGANRVIAVAEPLHVDLPGGWRRVASWPASCRRSAAASPSAGEPPSAFRATIGLYWALKVMTWRAPLVLGRQWPGLQLPLVIVSAMACFFG